MADEQNFPTAIVPTQPGTVAQRFDKLAKSFGDPMAKLFLLQGSSDEEMQFKAAAELMPYRYPKLKVSEIRAGEGGGAGVNIQINIGVPPPAPVVDVTPPKEEDPLA